MTGHEDGYTILEALCAFAILALSLTSLFGMGDLPLRATARGESMTQAALFAASKLQELGARRSPLPQSDQGQTPDKLLLWRFEARSMSQLHVEGSGLVLQDVRLVVRWQSDDGERSLVFTTRHLGATRL